MAITTPNVQLRLEAYRLIAKLNEADYSTRTKLSWLQDLHIELNRLIENAKVTN